MDLTFSLLTLLSKSGCGILSMQPALGEALLAEATLFICRSVPNCG